MDRNEVKFKVLSGTHNDAILPYAKGNQYILTWLLLGLGIGVNAKWNVKKIRPDGDNDLDDLRFKDQSVSHCCFWNQRNEMIIVQANIENLAFL
jgi:hypothetical protein